MRRKCQDLPWAQYIDKKWQYLQTVVTVLTFVLISDATIPKKISFWGFTFVILTFPFFTLKWCFLCALCGNVTKFCSFTLNINMKNPLLKSQVCTESINTIMENNWSHKSEANSTFYKMEMEDLPLSSCMFIYTYPVCFAVMKFPSSL